MPPASTGHVLAEVSEDIDAQEKTDVVLADIFWREYEIAEVGKVVSGVPASGGIGMGGGDLEYEVGVLVGDGVERKRKRVHESGECPVGTRVRRAGDLPGYVARGFGTKKLKRRIAVKPSGFQRVEDHTRERVASAGGAVVQVDDTVVDKGLVRDRAPVSARTDGGGRVFRISKSRIGEAKKPARMGGTGGGVGGAKCPSPKSGAGSGGGRRELRSGKGWPNGRGIPKREIGDRHADILVEYMFRRTGTRFRVPDPAPTVSSYFPIIYSIRICDDSNIE